MTPPDQPPPDEPAPGEPAPDRPDAEWFATVWADRDYHDLVRSRRSVEPPGPDATGGASAAAQPPAFPIGHEPWEIVLGGDEVRLGRRGAGPGEVPEIDLGGPPRDPGVSHRHAVLLALPGGRWVVIDVGSTNGTTLNYAEEPLTPDTPQPLRPGDRIHLGAWTTVTVGRR